MNIEFLRWVAEETKSRYKIDILKILGITVKEFILNSYSEVIKTYEDNGIIYIIEVDGKVVGMGGLRRLEGNVCEIKRMYIRQQYRGAGYGKKLLLKLLETAKYFRYSLIKLESSLFMETAHHIYRSHGFKNCNEYPGVETPEPMKGYEVYMEKEID